MSFDTKCIADHIRHNKEFDYIRLVSSYYKQDYFGLCDFSLDLYNYQRRNGLDKSSAKMMSLHRTAEYAFELYRKNIKEE